MIKYDKAFELMKEKGITTYKIRKENIVSQSAYTKMKRNGHIDTHTIERLCKALECQPGDLMEYVPTPFNTEDE